MNWLVRSTWWSHISISIDRHIMQIGDEDVIESLSFVSLSSWRTWEAVLMPIVQLRWKKQKSRRDGWIHHPIIRFPFCKKKEEKRWNNKESLCLSTFLVSGAGLMTRSAPPAAATHFFYYSYVCHQAAYWLSIMYPFALHITVHSFS